MIDLIKYTSIFFVIAPLILSAITYRSFRFSRALFIFLAVGFVADLFNLLYEAQAMQKQIVWDLYSIFECTMLVWMIRYRKNALALKVCLQILVFISIPAWLFCTYLYGNSMMTAIFTIAPLSLFIILYQVYVMFYSAKEILWLSEQADRIITSPTYWIFTGIFFYSIGTFFIMGFLSTPSILIPMFYINNIINITTHLLMLAGLGIFLFTSDAVKSHANK